jgi:integrase
MIALTEEAAALLEYSIQEARDIKADFGQILNQGDFIFLNPKRGVPYCVTHLNRIMSYVSEESGVKSSPHMMRHTFTTQASLAGVNGRALADYLGHKKNLHDGALYSRHRGRQPESHSDRQHPYAWLKWLYNNKNALGIFSEMDQKIPDKSRVRIFSTRFKQILKNGKC